MPIHDWSRVSAGVFHDFHQDWTIEIRRTLNRGLLPPGYTALTDLRVNALEPDVVAIQGSGAPAPGGLAVADAPRAPARSPASSPSRRPTPARRTVSRSATNSDRSWP